MATLPDTASDAAAPWWHLFVPKLFTVLRQGYGLADLRADTLSGLTVAIVALPLAMALAIASGTTPDKGLVTVVVAGLLISALGGSRFQIGGPTGAFVVVVFNVIAEFGYDGLLTATLMAGLMLILAGAFRLGTWIKYIPQPVVLGFTAGIAVIIASSQIKDFFGLALERVPADFAEKLAAFWAARASLDGPTTAVALGSLLTILALRRFVPKLPGFLVVVVLAALAVGLFGLPVETIGARFGGIPASLPAPSLPSLDPARLAALLPSAFTIAFLAGVESLLSAVVADSMTGRRHRSNCEIVAQGVANTASALFGGLPATGAIARTATNIRAGARSPISGMLHALFVLGFMLVAAPLAGYVPLAALAAVLLIVAWNMSEAHRLLHVFRMPRGDALTLIVTFVLTVAVDLTVAIQVGVVLAAILFMDRMSRAVEVQTELHLIESDVDDFTRPAGDAYSMRAELPPDTEVFQMRGPFFFGVASRFAETLDRITRMPKVVILRMREVPMIDATGADALLDFVARVRRGGGKVVLSGVRPQALATLRRMGLADGQDGLILVADFQAALAEARALVGTGG
jgi:SulP family sulfate permease